MKTTIPLMFIVLTGALSAAQPPAGHRPPPPPPHGPPLMAVFDADHDGVLSAEEIQNASATLAKLDQNGDGKITKDELRPPPPKDKNAPAGTNPQGPPPGPPPAPPVIAALDADQNGTISAEELKNAPESLKQLDTNGDGELSPEELHPHGPPPPPDGANSDGPPPPPDESGEPVPAE